MKSNLYFCFPILRNMNYYSIYSQNKELSVKGRYVALADIEPVLLRLQNTSEVNVLGTSVLGKPIYVYKKGKGVHKIMMWSQMHGNESTTTKAVLDLFNFLESEEAESILQKFTLCIIPMLNPDGAEVWTRNNANDIDLNRDAQALSQPESQVLRKCLEDFQPDFCFNLHDQRSIFGVKGTNKPATISFLSPSYNPKKEVNNTRKKAMELISCMNDSLQKYIPNQMGRYDDGFNINCIGDTVQLMGIPTVLLEAGHFQGDYQREETRKFVFIALLSGLYNLRFDTINTSKYLEYFNIPNNKAMFFDFIYKNIKLNYDNQQIFTNFASHYSEKVLDRDIHFEASIKEIGELEGFIGHFEYDAQGEMYVDNFNNYPEINQKADFYIGSQAFRNGLPFTK